MACAVHDVGIDLFPTSRLQRFGSLGKRLHGHDVVLIAMDQQNRRTAHQFIGEQLRLKQATRKRTDPRDSIFTTRGPEQVVSHRDFTLTLLHVFVVRHIV